MVGYSCICYLTIEGLVFISKVLQKHFRIEDLLFGCIVISSQIEEVKFQELVHDGLGHMVDLACKVAGQVVQCGDIVTACFADRLSLIGTLHGIRFIWVAYGVLSRTTKRCRPLEDGYQPKMGSLSLGDSELLASYTY
jgi:hypothetical protein